LNIASPSSTPTLALKTNILLSDFMSFSILDSRECKTEFANHLCGRFANHLYGRLNWKKLKIGEGLE
jgi:hypothetical protein